jgi:Polyketide cyclase / dehydrase and lipid transport
MQRTISLSTDIKRPVSVVYGHLAQPTNWIGLQPLLTSISPIEVALCDGRPCLRYTTNERFRLAGPLAIDNRIAVQTTLTRQDERIDTLVNSFPRLTLAAAYTFQPTPGGTALALQITISGPRAVLGYVTRTAHRVQQQTLANLKARLEQTPTEAHP